MITHAHKRQIVNTCDFESAPSLSEILVSTLPFPFLWKCFFSKIWFPKGSIHYRLRTLHTHLDICNSAYQEWIYACDDNTSYQKGFCPRHLYVWHPTWFWNLKICFINTSQTMQCINTIYFNTFEKQSVSESNALLREFVVYHTSLLVLPRPGVIQP